MEKPIEFTKCLTEDARLLKAINGPRDYKHIELICKDYNQSVSQPGQFDVIFAYDDNRSEGVLYLGHWNDGVVQ